MAKRAQVIMMGEDATELNKFFPEQLPAAGTKNLLKAEAGQSPLRLLYGARHRPPPAK